MIRRVDDFVTAMERSRKDTLRIMEKLTDASLGTSIAEGHRTLGGLAWHLAISLVEMANRTGLGLESVDQEAPPPAAADRIREVYAAASREVIDRVRGDWDDGTLEQADDMYGEQWKRGFTLWVLLTHEIHHRGQMTVLMRKAGLKVPGIYGPSLEEWAQYGMKAPAY